MPETVCTTAKQVQDHVLSYSKEMIIESLQKRFSDSEEEQHERRPAKINDVHALDLSTAGSCSLHFSPAAAAAAMVHSLIRSAGTVTHSSWRIMVLSNPRCLTATICIKHPAHFPSSHDRHDAYKLHPYLPHYAPSNSTTCLIMIRFKSQSCSFNFSSL